MFKSIWFLLQLGINQELFQNIFSYLSSFTRRLNRPLSLYTFFNNYSINKIHTFVFLFPGGFQTLSPCRFKDPCGFKEHSWIQGYFQKQTCFVSCFLEVDMFCKSRRVLLLDASASHILYIFNLSFFCYFLHVIQLDACQINGTQILYCNFCIPLIVTCNVVDYSFFFSFCFFIFNVGYFIMKVK